MGGLGLWRCMTRSVLFLVLAAAAAWAGVVGQVVGYVVDYVNGTSREFYFLQLGDGSLVPLAGGAPWMLGCPPRWWGASPT